VNRWHSQNSYQKIVILRGKNIEKQFKISINKKLLYNFDIEKMAARTNKKWIAAKKAQLQKQASRLKGTKRFEYPKRRLASLEEAKDLGIVWVKTNPRGRDYTRFLRGRKICWETRLRVDPDGFRFVKLPSGGTDFVEVPVSGWLRKKMMKNVRSK